jgi:hypothetical protein
LNSQTIVRQCDGKKYVNAAARYFDEKNEKKMTATISICILTTCIKTQHNLHLSNLHIVCNLQFILHVEIGEKVVQENKKSKNTLFVHEN